MSQHVGGPSPVMDDANAEDTWSQEAGSSTSPTSHTRFRLPHGNPSLKPTGSPSSLLSRPREWTDQMSYALQEGYRRYGPRNWAQLLSDPLLGPHFPGWSTDELEDTVRSKFPHLFREKPAGPSSNPRKQLRTSQQQTAGPSLKARSRERRAFTKSEDEALLQGFQRFGTHWARISRDPVFQGQRSSTDIRDRFRNAFHDEYVKAGYKPRTKASKRDRGEKKSKQASKSSPTPMDTPSLSPQLQPGSALTNPLSSTSASGPRMDGTSLLLAPHANGIDASDDSAVTQLALSADASTTMPLNEASQPLFPWLTPQSMTGLSMPSPPLAQLSIPSPLSTSSAYDMVSPTGLSPNDTSVSVTIPPPMAPLQHAAYVTSSSLPIDASLHPHPSSISFLSTATQASPTSSNESVTALQRGMSLQNWMTPSYGRSDVGMHPSSSSISLPAPESMALPYSSSSTNMVPIPYASMPVRAMTDSQPMPTSPASSVTIGVAMQTPWTIPGPQEMSSVSAQSSSKSTSAQFPMPPPQQPPTLE